MSEELLIYFSFIAFILSLVGFLVVVFRIRYGFQIIAAAFLLLLTPLLLSYLINTYSASVPEVAVPAVIGLPKEEAFSLLESFSLRPHLGGVVFDQTFSAGRIVSQRPEGGRRVKAGRIVNLILSQGPLPGFSPTATPEPGGE